MVEALDVNGSFRMSGVDLTENSSRSDSRNVRFEGRDGNILFRSLSLIYRKCISLDSVFGQGRQRRVQTLTCKTAQLGLQIKPIYPVFGKARISQVVAAIFEETYKASARDHNSFSAEARPFFVSAAPRNAESRLNGLNGQNGRQRGLKICR